MFDNDPRFTIGTSTDFDKRNTNTNIVCVSDSYIGYRNQIPNTECIEDISKSFVDKCTSDKNFILCHNIHIKININIDTSSTGSKRFDKSITIYGDKVSKVQVPSMEQGQDC